MKMVKFIFAVVLMLAFSGCKSKSAELRNPAEVETSAAQGKSRSGKKSKEQNLPKKESVRPYSDAELDEFLKRNEVPSQDPVAYYYAGNRCADKGEYEEAAKLYALAAAEFQLSPYKYGKHCNEYDWQESYPGTLDENGECEEFYYSIYNLSCCMSLLGMLELSEAYLYNAIIAGYPHLNHLLSDPDLVNLYAGPRGDEVKERAKKLFVCGNSADFLCGKKVPQHIPTEAMWYVNFDKNGKDVFCYSYYDEDPWNAEYPWCLRGTYTVKNFHVLIQFDSVWERWGRGGTKWNGAAIGDGASDVYWLPVIKKEFRYKRYMLSSVCAFNDGLFWWKDFPLDENDDLVRGTFLESVLSGDGKYCCFLHFSCVNFFDEVFREAEEVKWSPEESEKNRELNWLNEERRKKQAATAPIEISPEEIDANAIRRLARYREFADPIIRGYKEKGKAVVLDAETFADSEKNASPQETEFCYVVIKGMLKNSDAFESVCKAAEKRFAAGFFLDFTDCESGDGECNFSPFEVAGLKGIIFPKNLTEADLLLGDDKGEIEIIEFQDAAMPLTKPVEIGGGWYNSFENTSLKAVRLPEGLEKICRFTFMKCTALEQVYAPKSLEEIDYFAFYGCDALAFEIPENVRYVRDNVFGPQTQLYIPAYRHHPENFDWYYSCFDYTGENVHWGSCLTEPVVMLQRSLAGAGVFCR